MKKTVPEQVRAYMEWKAKSLGGEFGDADLAREVARFQGSIPEKSRCKRQDIENLFKKNIQRPRYLPELAMALGTTAEILAAGNYVPGAPLPARIHELNGIEGHLIALFRTLSPDEQTAVLENISRRIEGHIELHGPDESNEKKKQRETV